MNNYYFKPREELSAEEEVNRFLHKYESQAGLTQRKLYYKRKPYRYVDWTAQGSPLPFEQDIEKEPMVEMFIPQHRFEDLVERERLIRRIEEENFELKSIVQRDLEDQRVRNNNPAVRAAYEKYRMLLELCRQS